MLEVQQEQPKLSLRLCNVNAYDCKQYILTYFVENSCKTTNELLIQQAILSVNYVRVVAISD